MSSTAEGTRLKGLVLADFNADVLCGYLTHAQLPRSAASPAQKEGQAAAVKPLNLAVTSGRYGQVQSVLLEPQAPEWAGNPDFVVIWTQPQAVLPSIRRALEHEAVSVDEVLAEVDAFTHAVLSAKERSRFLFVANWILPRPSRNYELLEGKLPGGPTNLLLAANLRLATNLGDAASVLLLPAQSWMESTGAAAGFSPKLWYLAKVPFSNALFKEAAACVRRALDTVTGRTRKLIVLDLDDTLWGGIVGDVGLSGIKLGGHHHVGEAFVDFQRALKGLQKRGVMLGIVSKNEESVALEAIRSHPEMVLVIDDFVGWRINWNDKAENVVDLVREINVGLQSVVFIDDNPAERQRVRDALPEVLVPEWPSDKTLYRAALLDLGCFDSIALTEEDRLRTGTYSALRLRAELSVQVGSYSEWLKTLGVVVLCEPLNETNKTRVSQLLNKTNQMNLKTRRMSEDELMRWAAEEGNSVWAFRVSDKFGDMGLTGILSMHANGADTSVEDFVLSCRVMGRNVEESMLHVAVKAARARGLARLSAHFISTPKNKPCLDFWLRSGFAHDAASNVFSWDLKREYAAPENITLVLP